MGDTNLGATMVGVDVANFSDSSVNAVSGSGNSNLPAGMMITVNLNGAFFQDGPSAFVGYNVPAWITGGSDAAQALILLHELAHNLGANGFQSDAGTNQAAIDAQKSNNGLVMENCGNVVAVAAGKI